jgi:hypothetical protein
MSYSEMKDKFHYPEFILILLLAIAQKVRCCCSFILYAISED